MEQRNLPVRQTASNLAKWKSDLDSRKLRSLNSFAVTRRRHPLVALGQMSRLADQPSISIQLGLNVVIQTWRLCTLKLCLE